MHAFDYRYVNGGQASSSAGAKRGRGTSQPLDGAVRKLNAESRWSSPTSTGPVRRGGRHGRRERRDRGRHHRHRIRIRQLSTEPCIRTTGALALGMRTEASGQALKRGSTPMNTLRRRRPRAASWWSCWAAGEVVDGAVDRVLNRCPRIPPLLKLEPEKINAPAGHATSAQGGDGHHPARRWTSGIDGDDVTVPSCRERCASATGRPGRRDSPVPRATTTSPARSCGARPPSGGYSHRRQTGRAQRWATAAVRCGC